MSASPEKLLNKSLSVCAPRHAQIEDTVNLAWGSHGVLRHEQDLAICVGRPVGSGPQSRVIGQGPRIPQTRGAEGMHSASIEMAGRSPPVESFFVKSAWFIDVFLSLTNR